MARDLTPPDPKPVLDLLMAYRSSQVLFTSATLGVFDALADGPKPIAELAEQLGCNLDAFERLVGAATMHGLLHWDNQDGGAGMVANTPTAQAYLTQHSPERLLGYVHYSGNVLWKVWQNLPDAIREVPTAGSKLTVGTSRFLTAFSNRPKPCGSSCSACTATAESVAPKWWPHST